MARGDKHGVVMQSDIGAAGSAGVAAQRQITGRVENGAAASEAIEALSYFTREGGLYRASAAIARGEEIVPGSNCAETTVADELSAVCDMTASAVTAEGEATVEKTVTGGVPHLTFGIPRGPAGPKGDTGATGAQGPKGDKGATGAQGPKGDKGDTGATGAQGPKGDKGDTGATGAQGPKGDKGDTGEAGPRGEAGPNSITTSTATTINGLLRGDGSTVSAASAVGSATRGVYVNSNGNLVQMSYSVYRDVPSNARFTDTTYGNATQSVAGLMSAADKTKLDGVAAGATANAGTITKVQANGTDVASGGTANIPAASTSAYGVTKLSSSTGSSSTSLAATPSAVKAAYDLASGRAPLASPAFTGTPTAPTAGLGNNSTQLATTAHVQSSAAATVAPAFSAAASYSAGDYVLAFGSVYRCIAEHSGAWDSSHFTELPVTIGEELASYLPTLFAPLGLGGGGAAKVVPTGADLNDAQYCNSGFYAWSASLTPTSSNHVPAKQCAMLVIRRTSNNLVQIAVSLSSDTAVPTVYLRRRLSGSSWTGWYTLKSTCWE